jgi:hypothetical protein
MTGVDEDGPTARVAALAKDQHGVVTAAQLLSCGLTRTAIRGREQAGALHRLHRGLYAVGHAALREDARWAGAVLRGGTGSVVSHESAAAVELLLPVTEPLHVTRTGTRGRRLPGLVVHEGTVLPDEVKHVRGIPITVTTRTLLDLGDRRDPRPASTATGVALDRGLVTVPVLRRAIAEARGRHGCRVLTELLDAMDAGMSRSVMERRAFDGVVETGLREPEVNGDVLGQEVDLVWRPEKVALELDSLALHLGREAFVVDRRRSNALQAEGWVALRWVWADVASRQTRALAELAVLLDRRVNVREVA